MIEGVAYSGNSQIIVISGRFVNQCNQWSVRESL